MVAVAASSTPGTARMRSSKSRLKAISLSTGIFKRDRSRSAIRMPSFRKPVSSVRRLRKLRANSSAPTRSTSDIAICETTSIRRSPKRSRLAVKPRPPDFIATPGLARVARRAGASPNRMQVSIAKTAVNANTRQSGARSTKSGSPSALRNRTRNWLNIRAKKTPRTAPTMASRRLSASN